MSLIDWVFDHIVGIAVSIIVLFGGFAVICVVIGFFGGALPHYSDGSRSGVVYKISRKGLIWKSSEGKLQLSQFNLRNGESSEGNVWDFSVQDANVVRDIDRAVSSGSRVTLHYHQYLFPPIIIDTDFVVDRVSTEGAQ